MTGSQTFVATFLKWLLPPLSAPGQVLSPTLVRLFVIFDQTICSLLSTTPRVRHFLLLKGLYLLPNSAAIKNVLAHPRIFALRTS